ncbi:hypothetical protein NHX12_012566 [Muraenolepis orangiensis]|uniref:Uncharacterized protein n=1 Tax=Muraenolepis orangiensis TaxID=630683 RepID=A0A9Q0I5K2_9TELE|nr:hypothetical protein NHX12_012566 [Muraenolepis orangiensis]
MYFIFFSQTDEEGIEVEDVSEIEDNIDPDLDPDHCETDQSTDGEEEAPEEDTPEEEAPEEETPEEDTPGEEAPEEDTPGKEAPEEDTPGKEAPEEEAPEEDTPGEEAPEEEAPEEEAPEEEAPEEDTPGEEAPEVTFQSKDGNLLWYSSTQDRGGRARVENIVRITPGPTRYATSRVDDIKSSSQLFLPFNYTGDDKPEGEACVCGHMESIGPGHDVPMKTLRIRAVGHKCTPHAGAEGFIRAPQGILPCGVRHRPEPGQGCDLGGPGHNLGPLGASSCRLGP